MFIFCEVLVAVGVFLAPTTLKGKVISEGSAKYMADFSADLQHTIAENPNITSDPKDFKQLLVDKVKCVPEKQ